MGWKFLRVRGLPYSPFFGDTMSKLYYCAIFLTGIVMVFGDDIAEEMGFENPKAAHAVMVVIGAITTAIVFAMHAVSLKKKREEQAAKIREQTQRLQSGRIDVI
jgi:hypothetical protein